MMVVANVAVLQLRAGGPLAAAPLAGRRATASVVGRVLSAAAAGDGVDGCFIDGGDGVAPPSRVQLVCVLRHLVAVLEVLRNNMVDHVGGKAEEKRRHEVRAGGRAWRQQGLHLPHHLRWLHVANFWELMQLECFGPAVHGVPGHQQGFQLLVRVGVVLVDLRQAVVDAAADFRGQGREQVIVFCRRLLYVADSELALDFSKSGVRVVGPEVGNLECHVGHVLVLVIFILFFCRHLVCSQRSVA
jgi:hypothetical protein